MFDYCSLSKVEKNSGRYHLIFFFFFNRRTFGPGPELCNYLTGHSSSAGIIPCHEA